jgi:hypothetical protein
MDAIRRPETFVVSYAYKTHGVSTQKTTIDIFTAVRISNIRWLLHRYAYERSVFPLLRHAALCLPGYSKGRNPQLLGAVSTCCPWQSDDSEHGDAGDRRLNVRYELWQEPDVTHIHEVSTYVDRSTDLHCVQSGANFNLIWGTKWVKHVSSSYVGTSRKKNITC